MEAFFKIAQALREVGLSLHNFIENPGFTSYAKA